MNILYKNQGDKLLVKADGGEKIIPNTDKALEILKIENVIEMLNYYLKRDEDNLSQSYEDLWEFDKKNCIFRVGCSIAAVSAGLLYVNGVESEIFGGVAVAALAGCAFSAICSDYRLENDKWVNGISKCVDYENYKLDSLKKEKEELIKVGKPVFKITDKACLIDDRAEKKRIDTVLNFIFYMGNHKNKILRLVKDYKLQSFLRKQGIKDIDTIIEIESYVNSLYMDVLHEDYSYLKK